MLITVKNIKIDTKERQIAFANILDAATELYHFVWIPKKAIQEIKRQDLNFLGAFQRSTLENLLHKIGDDGHQYINKLSIYLTIDFCKEEDIYTKIENNIISSYKNFIEKSSLRESTLLAENLNDAKFYIYLGNLYKEKILKKDLKIVLKANQLSGGGDSTHEVFTQITNTSGPLLCILDSDKCHPNQTTPGETAKKVLAAERKTPLTNIVSVMILPVRTIENLIPTILLDKIKKEDKELGLVYYDPDPKFKKFVKCKDTNYKKKKSSDPNHITLLDIKEDFCTNDKVKYFWEKFYEKYKSHSPETIVYSNLHRILKTRNAKNLGFLQVCINYLLEDHSVKEEIIADDTSDLIKIGHEVFSWTFSYQILSA